MKIKRDRLLAIMETAGIEPDQLRVKGYGAFGTTCPGIEIDGLAQLAAFFAAAGYMRYDLEEYAEPDFDPDDLTKGVCMDTIGYGLVFFWPDLELEE